MFAYRLSPIREHREHPNWSVSEHHGECLVFAETETEARRYAAERFRAPLVPESQVDPWLSAELVDARRGVIRDEAEDIPAAPAGTVVPVMSMEAYAARAAAEIRRRRVER